LDIVEHIYIYYIPDGLIFPKWFDICEDKFIDAGTLSPVSPDDDASK